MTARVLFTAALQKSPTQKTSSRGSQYLIATLREGNGDAGVFWTAFVFSQSLIEEFQQLEVGESVSVAGTLDAKVYTPNGGEPRVSLSIVVDGILTARKPKKEKDKTKSASTPTSNKTRDVEQGRPPVPFDDEIPF